MFMLEWKFVNNVRVVFLIRYLHVGGQTGDLVRSCRQHKILHEQSGRQTFNNFGLLLLC